MKPADELVQLQRALRGIATNQLSSTTAQDPAYRAGISAGLAMAADMARKALDGIYPPSNPDSPCRHLDFCPVCNPALAERR